MTPADAIDAAHMRAALRLAARGYGATSPNPLVGAVLVRRGRVVGRGWHRRAGHPHAEVEALRDAAARGADPAGATLYVTLEPCCTHGRTPPCTDALVAARIARVVVAATDPNPAHAGRGLAILRQAGIEVATGVLADDSSGLNEAFEHWVTRRTPFVVAKAAMTLDGRIADHTGRSRWITGPSSRAHAMRLRLGADATLVGSGTVLADDPALTVRAVPGFRPPAWSARKRRIVLDTRARTPAGTALISDAARADTLVVVGESAPARRVDPLRRRVEVLVAAERDGRIDLAALMPRLGAMGIASLLVEGGGEVLGSFFAAGLVHRTAFFYAPLVLGGAGGRRAVAGGGFRSLREAPSLADVESRRFGDDLFVTARVVAPRGDAGVA